MENRTGIYYSVAWLVKWSRWTAPLNMSNRRRCPTFWKLSLRTEFDSMIWNIRPGHSLQSKNPSTQGCRVNPELVVYIFMECNQHHRTLKLEEFSIALCRFCFLFFSIFSYSSLPENIRREIDLISDAINSTDLHSKSSNRISTSYKKFICLQITL